MSCGIGHGCGLDLALLWPWCRPAATIPIRPLAWELPHAVGASLKSQKKEKKKKIHVGFSVTTTKCCKKEKSNLGHFSFINGHGKSHSKHQVVSASILWQRIVPSRVLLSLQAPVQVFSLLWCFLWLFRQTSVHFSAFSMNIIYTLLILTRITSYCNYLNCVLLLTRSSLCTEPLVFHLSTTSIWDWTWNSAGTQ